MATRKADVVAAALQSKGMTPDENHHHMLRMEVDGTTQLVTRVSHSAKEIDDHLGGLMARQCALFLKEFWQLVDCPMDTDQWVNLIRERCKSGRNPFIR